jgi:hypothetical protein
MTAPDVDMDRGRFMNSTLAMGSMRGMTERASSARAPASCARAKSSVLYVYARSSRAVSEAWSAYSACPIKESKIPIYVICIILFSISEI